jgi:hypothetical protein
MILLSSEDKQQEKALVRAQETNSHTHHNKVKQSIDFSLGSSWPGPCSPLKDFEFLASRARLPKYAPI